MPAAKNTSQKVLADSPVDNSVESTKKINGDNGLRYPPAFCEVLALSAKRMDWRIAGGCLYRYGKNLMKSTGYGVLLLADKLADSWRAVLSANPPPPYKVADSWRMCLADGLLCITLRSRT